MSTIPWGLASKGVPAEAQRSGFGGERSHSGMSELCPKGGASGYGAYGDEGAIKALTGG